MSDVALAQHALAKPALKRRLVGALKLTVAATMIFGSVAHVAERYMAAPPAGTVSMAGLSDQAIVQLLRSGKTVAILNAGPGESAALGIATTMGNAVVAPRIDDSNGMAAALEQAARTLKAKGFRGIAFLGAGSEARRAQAQVAEKLGREWAGMKIRVLDAGDCCGGSGAPAAKADLIKRVMTRLDA